MERQVLSWYGHLWGSRMRQKAWYPINTEGEEGYNWDMRDRVISPCSYKENYFGSRQAVQKVEVPWGC